VVSHAIKRYNEAGKHEDRKGRGRKRTSRDEANIGEARNQLRQNIQTKRRNGAVIKAKGGHFE
uniref:Uncharacterized protein n=1 Tax=Acrobeloides nanus TaxID=290746 RepID=A0A914DWL4_9BILA